MLNRKGSILLITYSVVVVLLILAGILFTRTLFDAQLFSMNKERLQALYLAESGVDQAIRQLTPPNSFSNGNSGLLSLSSGGAVVGQYNYTISDTSPASSQRKSIISSGYIPNYAQKRAERDINVITKIVAPPNFFDYVLYAANDLNINGISYSVSGKAIYGDSETGNLSNISWTDPATGIVYYSSITGSPPAVTQDSSISPLALLDFSYLRSIAQSQGNLYPADGSNTNKFPTTFYHNNDPAQGVNVIYVEGNMVLKNSTVSNKTAGGFYVVVGTNPGVSIDNTTMDGNVTVNGAIYTTGYFIDNGGGNHLNVNGGIWAGTDINLNGGIDVSYNLPFMTTIKNLINNDPNVKNIQVSSWKILK